ncbi:MAG: hypothetical protein JWL95_1748 [Gemmatimonadetes bacterium]|nr:hypothetical protein [Gemmatimonadota bacterium]
MIGETSLNRREWMMRAAGMLCGGVVLGGLFPELGVAAPKPATITVYKDPSCGCCTKWVAHLQANGLTPQVHDRSDMDALKDSLGVPKALRSCHTAVAGKYVIEGHVPASDLKRLLASAPPKVLGLAVPDMPAGSPGMEMGARADRYDVIAFAADGTTRPYAHH